MNRAGFFVGTSGWSHKHWRGLFYPVDLPQREWFTHYAKYFPSVAINYTFYRLPSTKTFVRWRRQCPHEFVYSLKAPRTITHPKKLRRCAESVEAFLGRARLLGDRLGPILLPVATKLALLWSDWLTFWSFCPEICGTFSSSETRAGTSNRLWTC